FQTGFIKKDDLRADVRYPKVRVPSQPGERTGDREVLTKPPFGTGGLFQEDAQDWQTAAGLEDVELVERQLQPFLFLPGLSQAPALRGNLPEFPAGQVSPQAVLVLPQDRNLHVPMSPGDPSDE